MLISPTSSNKSSLIKGHFGVRRGCRLQHVTQSPTNQNVGHLNALAILSNGANCTDGMILNNVELQPFTKTDSVGMEVMFSLGALKVALDGVR
jgi:hypothetical protein